MAFLSMLWSESLGGPPPRRKRRRSIGKDCLFATWENKTPHRQEPFEQLKDAEDAVVYVTLFDSILKFRFATRISVVSSPVRTMGIVQQLARVRSTWALSRTLPIVHTREPKYTQSPTHSAQTPIGRLGGSGRGAPSQKPDASDFFA